MRGAVCYDPGECPYFRRRTVVQPENLFDVRHYQLGIFVSQARLEVIGPMPTDFEGRLEEAIRGSTLIDKRRWNALAECLPWLDLK